MEKVPLPLESAFAHQLVHDWLSAWNDHDLERILSHYDDEVELISPVTLKLLNNGDGVVRGKAALREYFRRGLQAYPNLHFELIEVLWGIETVVAYYRNNVRDNKSAEVMQVTSAGKVRRVWANYDK